MRRSLLGKFFNSTIGGIDPLMDTLQATPAGETNAQSPPTPCEAG
jgi:hypothetical protein